MKRRRFVAAELRVRAVREHDIEALQEFSCSSGVAWEQEVEEEIRLRLARRYIEQAGSELDPRMLVVHAADDQILGVTTHRIEPVTVIANGAVVDLRPTYLEVIAVSCDVWGSRVDLEDGEELLSFGEFMFEIATQDARSRPNRIPL